MIVFYMTTLCLIWTIKYIFLSAELFRVSSMNATSAWETRTNYTFPQNTLNPLSPNTEYSLFSTSSSNTMHILILSGYILMFQWWRLPSSGKTMPQIKRYLLIVTFFCSVALSSLITVVATTKTCQNIAWLYKYMQVLDQLVDSNLIDTHGTNSIVIFTEYSITKRETDIFNLLQTMKIFTWTHFLIKISSYV
jgi:hypothetical protein